MSVELQGRGGVYRCDHCHMLNAFLKREPDGSIYFGDYMILREAGQGANAIVCKVKHIPTGSTRALKIFAAEALEEVHARREYFRESQIATEMIHPNIIRVFSAGELDNIPFVVMEFVSGLNMAQMLQDYGPVNQFDALSIATYILDALDYVWSSFLMIHRDIKPQNIILDREGVVKVCDFGMVTDHEAAAVDLDSVEGTPYYLSPECVQEGFHLDNRSDIYSLGASLYHMISGSPPFDYSTLHEVVHARLREPPPDMRRIFPQVHPEIAQIIQTMMAKDPNNRYVTAGECKEDMERVKAGLSPLLRDPNRIKQNQ